MSLDFSLKWRWFFISVTCGAVILLGYRRDVGGGSSAEALRKEAMGFRSASNRESSI